MSQLLKPPKGKHNKKIDVNVLDLCNYSEFDDSENEEGNQAKKLKEKPELDSKFSPDRLLGREHEKATEVNDEYTKLHTLKVTIIYSFRQGTKLVPSPFWPQPFGIKTKKNWKTNTEPIKTSQMIFPFPNCR